MGLSVPPEMIDPVVSLLTAVGVFSAVVVVAWPYLARDILADRMRGIASEREQLRRNERRKGVTADPILSLRKRPRKLYESIVEWLDLRNQAKDGAVARTLKTAGYRGDAAVVTYLAARIIGTVAMAAIAALYVFVILRLPQPLMIKLLIPVVAGGLGYFLPALYVKNRITKRQQSVQRAWPDALDLMLICVESGMSIEFALQKVAGEIGKQSVELAEELALTTAELSYLPERRQAYENLATRTGLDGVKAVVASLKQAEKHGTSLGRSLRVLAQENRDMRLFMAEEKAASLPPKLTVPMILFFLPVLFAVIITPAAIQIAEAL